ncbi:MAG: thioesterase family protein [Citromicrobium sp.]|nr:MAG: thioesterase family protein [Citromicrobium sp.]
MSIANLVDAITGKNGTFNLEGAENWLQGRTLYGGASALIAYTAATRAFRDLPVLRAAQVAFVAPIGESMNLHSEIVREGRNVTQVRSEIRTEKGCALTAFWLFGAAREPNALHIAEKPGDWPGPPDQAEDPMPDKGPAFIQGNFDIRRAQSVRGSGDPVVRRWVRLKDRAGLDPVSELILMGDVLPPGAMRAMKRMGPISSINWSFNVLDAAPATRDGWFLSENASQHADSGYSSERLRLWTSKGSQVLDGMQCAAIFG